MEAAMFIEETFNKIDFKEQPPAKGEYDGCIFTACDFTGANLSAIKFVQCTFTDCNLSLVQLTKTSFMDAVFDKCKMLGFRFDNCDPFGLSFSFRHCNLSQSSFYKTKIKNTAFKDTLLQEVDFTECDLSGAIFEQCDLAGAIFDNTVLERANLTGAYNYTIDPELNRIKKAKFSLPAVTGLLHKYGIDIC